MYNTAKTPNQLHSSAKDLGFSTRDPVIVTSFVRMDGEKACKGSSQCWLELLWRETALTKHRSAKGTKSRRRAAEGFDAHTRTRQASLGLVPGV